MRFFLRTLLLAALAGFATAGYKETCQAKADATQSGVWCAINNFCNGFGPILQDLYSPYPTRGITCEGLKDGTQAYMRPKNCAQNLGGLTKANCFNAFWGVCALGGKKGRLEQKFGPKGCIKVGLKDA